MDGLVDEVVASVRQRGFLDAEPSQMAQHADVMRLLLVSISELGTIASNLYRDDADAASMSAWQLALTMNQLSLGIQRAGNGDTPREGNDVLKIPAADDGQLMWQVLKALEESGEFADALLHDRNVDAGSELADWLVTLCAVSDRLKQHIIAYDLEESVRGKIDQDVVRGFLHGMRSEGSAPTEQARNEGGEEESG